MVGQIPAGEIPGWLTKCDAGVLPMRRDVFLDFCFPNKLAEYIVMGKPVILSRLRGLPHYFSEEAVAYFEPDDARDLARQMVRLHRDRELCARIAARAAEEYAPIRWDVMKQRYLRLIESLTQPARLAERAQAA